MEGRVPLSSLSRLAEALASPEGYANVDCRFSRDEENRSIVDVDVEATVQVTCQRCLQNMPLRLDVQGRVAVVGDDEAAKQLPAALEPWVVGSETASLWHLVEDELMLALPVVAYHDSEDCKRLLDAYRRPPESGNPSGDNPFKVLERLKSGRTEEK
ncbi:MAG: YceD family protein [Halieaceae bacterium]|nr:YceD family protein [Halieaceae bacterium]